ncbi:50S ribosomal protein L25/general stress protein Ctc [Macrococcus hajekii]|uniref:Large ribosomal subunit protein bL25 n=1 Tax=Macrococcus hajekii TaxID=198482 RepID=A0A4R6BHR6_9STAP|nr:50S ribosomal protein L25/general stress protein Ctc [Macrococcus hajekii]TDM01039.1 50S ribosomal protein L25/general stress protein Ctc [Macrococcus hajekii]GGB12880.1 50S ribosomal protein L25 [Macrococcus hajekii]
MANLKAVERQGKSSRSELNSLRATGNIPAVIYGYGATNTAVHVNNADFIKVMREVGRNGVIELALDSGSTKVMVSDYQIDPIKQQVTHIDFLAINMKAELTVDVTVTLTGEAKGAEEGGVVQQPLFTLSVTATPDEIPETIEVDVTELNIGDSFTVEELRNSRNYTINNEDDETIVTVVPPTVVEEPEEGEEAAEGEEAENAEATEGGEEEKDAEEKAE